jgi:UDP-glucose 4-epimerase
MRVFITGIAGFLGSHLADRFLAQGHEVVGCDSMIGGDLDNVPAGAEYHQVDCKYLNTMIKLSKGCDVVYHCAATAYEGLSVFSPHLVTENIVNATVSVITAAVVNQARRFVFCSSMARYGRNRTPFTEDMVPNPEDPYGIGKYACELYLKNLAETHGMEYSIAVPHNIIGPRQKYNDPYRNVAAIMVNLMLQGRQPVIYGDGSQTRCFSFVQDTIQCLERMATLPDAAGEIINVGPDEQPVTINELAFLIGRLIGMEVRPTYVPPREREVPMATCSAEKARRLLGYRTEYTLERGIAEMIDYIRQRGTKPFKYHLTLEIVNEKTPVTWKDRTL